MTDRVLGEARDYPQLIELLRAWVAELGVAGETIDQRAGLPERYTAKLLASGDKVYARWRDGARGLGKSSLGPLLQTLGLKLHVLVDQEAIARITSGMEKIEHPSESIPAKKRRKKLRGGAVLRKNPEVARMLGQRRMLSQTPLQRSRLGKKANRLRWLRVSKQKRRRNARPGRPETAVNSAAPIL